VQTGREYLLKYNMCTCCKYKQEHQLEVQAEVSAGGTPELLDVRAGGEYLIEVQTKVLSLM
jgi:hypothetical protein